MKEDKQPINQSDQANALEGLINTPDGDVLSVPLVDNTIPEHYKRIDFYNWEGIYYLRQKPCIETEELPEGEVVEIINDYPAGNYKVYENGIITCRTICGIFNLKLK